VLWGSLMECLDVMQLLVRVRVTAGHPAWQLNMHEPLNLVFVFPFIRNEPWQLKRSPAIVGMGKHLLIMFKEGDGSLGFVLQQFWKRARSLDSMSKRMVSKVLHCRSGFEISYGAPGERRGVAVEEEDRR